MLTKRRKRYTEIHSNDLSFLAPFVKLFLFLIDAYLTGTLVYKLVSFVLLGFWDFAVIKFWR